MGGRGECQTRKNHSKAKEEKASETWLSLGEGRKGHFE